MVKLLVLFQKEIVKTLTKVLRHSRDCNSKTAIVRGIKPKDQVKGWKWITILLIY